VGKFGTGQAIRRTEDQRFITGTGRYTDDIALPDQACLYFFRSPYAHGRIAELDVSAAGAVPGVIAVYTADDLSKAGVRDVTGADLPKFAIGGRKPALRQPPLARERVRYVGEPVAAIVAESLNAAKDAAELIEFDVDELPAAVTVQDALADGATAVHDSVAGNRFGKLGYGTAEAVDGIFSSATYTVSIDVINNRLAPTAMEPRGCVIDFDRTDGRTTVYQGCQGVHALHERILQSIDMPADKLQVISPDVGGAFGLKFFLQCETVVAVFASRQLERPVRWIAERGESFLADLHGRDHVSHAELAINDDGRFLALRVSIDANLGAYCSQAGPVIPWFGACMSTGCYDIPAAHIVVQMVVTNTVPVDAYRGAGRPEATYLIERLVDQAARQTGIDRVELRRRNFVRPEQFPYRTPTGRSYDSGEYARVMDAALQRADWPGFEERRAASLAAGRLRGIGLAYYVEICSVGSGEDTHVQFEKDGRVTVLMGTQSTGQGHETSYAQMVAAGLGVDMDRIDIVQGDTARVPTGQGTNGSRSMAIGGSSLFRTVSTLIDSGRAMAGDMLEAASTDIEFEDGQFRIVGTDRVIGIDEVARASYDDEKRPDGVNAGLYSSEHFEPDGGTFPNGCHICEVEVDPDTGVVDILRYTVEDDVGTVINPLILEGQIVGGVAQGLGQALCEHAVYERDSGQLLTATFMDYAMPRSDWVPDVDFHYQEVPSPCNPLGVKGAGEAGTVGAAPALINAVIDALAPRGITHIDMPVSPQNVWRRLHDAGTATAG
jgi:carbon-monoxide dehydrogenase large subunit